MHELSTIQISVLYHLRHSTSARFSSLMRPTGLQSDSFKFHLRKLGKLGIIEKSPNGEYRLTSFGKEFSNRLDEHRADLRRQPKLSLLIVASRSKHGKVEFLLQQRKRQPFYGVWSHIGGPVEWGEDIETSAAKELQKQTALEGELTVRSFYRKRDYKEGADTLLEDKIFAIVEATQLKGEMRNTWPGGTNKWMTLAQLQAQPAYFESSLEVIELLRSQTPYVSRRAYYGEKEY